MKKLKCFVGIFIFFLTTLSALAIEDMPEWASTHKHSRYPSQLYLVGVGISSKSFDDAKEHARIDIAKQVKVQINAEDIIERMSRTVGEEYYYRMEVKSKTKSLVDEKLTGVQIVETSKGNGNFYALAVLDRMKVEEEMKLALKEAIETVSRLLTNADEQLKNGNVSGALANLSQAHSISCDIQLKKPLYQAISLMSLSEELLEKQSGKTPPDILSKLTDVLSRLQLVCISGNGQMGRLGKQLPEPLVVQLKFDTQEREIPVNGMEIQFESSPKELIEKQITDSDGEASVMVTATPPKEYDKYTGRVTAMLLLEKLPEELKGTLPVIYTVFHYGIEIETYPVRLSIVSEDGKNLPKLESKVKRNLSRLGYTVEKDAQVSLEGTLMITNVKEIGGLRPQTLVLVELELSILDAEEGAVLDSVFLSGKGLARTENMAFQKAAIGLKVDKRKVSTLLQVGKERFVKARERRSNIRFDEGEQLFNAGKYKAALRKLEEVAIGTEFYESAQKLVQQIMESMPPAPRPSIAIFEPKCDGSRRQKEIANTLRDMMTTSFIMNRDLRVIERERLAQIMKEVKLGLSGYVEQSQAAQIGKLAGADALLLGTLRLIGRNVELDVRLIKTETGESLAAATSKKSQDELRAIAEEITDQVVSFLDETPIVEMSKRVGKQTAIPSTENPSSETIEAPKIRVMVVMPEEHIRREIPRRIPDPAGETEIIRKFLEKGFLVIDQTQVKKIRDTEKVRLALKEPAAAAALATEFNADVIIVGEAFSVFDEAQGGRPEAGMISCRARIEARAVRTDDAAILAADGKHAAGLDPVEELAAKSALRNAGGLIADYFIKQILKKWGKEQAEGGTMTQILVYNIKEYGDLVRFESMLKSMGFVQAVHRRSFSETSARIDVELKGNAQKLADSLYTVKQPLVKVKVRNFSTNKVEVEIEN